MSTADDPLHDARAHASAAIRAEEERRAGDIARRRTRLDTQAGDFWAMLWDHVRVAARGCRAAGAAVLASGCVSAAPARPAPPASAATERTTDREFTRIVDSVRVATGLPALAAAVVTGDRVLARAAVGTRRAGGDVPVTAADQFHLGSDTKAMTAGLLGVLVDDGRVAWTTTLSEVWPELAPAMRAEYRDVTVADLLGHRSGLPRDPAVIFTDATEAQQRISLVRWAVAQPPTGARGSYGYSNVNYAVAGAIAERVTGRLYAVLMAERIFRPLGMRSVGWGAPGTPGRGAGQEDQPWQHRIAADGQREAVAPSPTADNPPVMAPAGRVHMSIGDWAAWGRVVLRAASGRPSLWRPATAAALTTPTTPISATERYGNGWIGTTRAWAGPTGRVLTHAGSNTMNVANAWLAPDADVGFLVVTNQGGAAATAATDALVGRLVAWDRAQRVGMPAARGATPR